MCNADWFEPNCSQNEIILIHFAKYGRLKLGKCLHNDLGYLGCHSNVLSQFDATCSGKQSCRIQVVDKNINTDGGCMQGLLQYLEISYTCVQGNNIYCLKLPY